MYSIAFAVPLVACISLVYTASRYELREKIIRDASIMFVKTIGGLAVLYGILTWLSWA